MTELQTAYQAVAAAVRTYAQLVQSQPAQERPPMLFVAQDICDGETCDCVMSGKVSEVSDALASACVVAPSLAAAVVVCAEAGDVGRAALEYVAGKASK